MARKASDFKIGSYYHLDYYGGLVAKRTVISKITSIYDEVVAYCDAVFFDPKTGEVGRAKRVPPYYFGDEINPDEIKKMKDEFIAKLTEF